MSVEGILPMDEIPLCRVGSLLCVLLSLVVGMPVNAQSPPPSANRTNAFDGVYVGVSAENNSQGNTLAGGRARTQGYAGARACLDFRAPARLTIANGHAQVRWGDRTLEGYAAPNGSLTMTTGYGQKFDGRIEAQQIKGQLVGYCTYSLTWRKQV
jgi:hypothetical protein